MISSENIGKLAEALSKAQAGFGPLIKGAANPFFKSKYADLASVMDVCRGPLSENNLAFVQTTDDSSDGLTVETTLMHSSGEWITGRLKMPVMKQDPQSYGSTLSYARRYALQAMLGLAAEDDDAESGMQRNGGGKQESKAEPPITDIQKKTLAGMMAKVGLSAAGQKAFYESVGPVTARDGADFIKNFNSRLDAWRMAQQQREPGSDDK